MYEKIDDGILLCKMINLAAPDTIDERVINTGKNISIFKVLVTYQTSLLVIILFPVQQHENLTLAINSAKAIGCVVIGIDSHTLNSGQVRADRLERMETSYLYFQGKKWLVLGLIWQLIKMYLFKQISISAVPGLINLLMDGEDIADLMKLSPEQLLVRWVNHQLQKVRLYYLHFIHGHTVIHLLSY